MTELTQSIQDSFDEIMDNTTRRQKYEWLSKTLDKSYQSGVEAERERIINGLDKLQTHGLDVNIHLDEAIEVVKALTNQGETK